MPRRPPPPDQTPAPKTDAAATVEETRLLNDLRALIQQARERAASSVNIELTLLYWRIGQRLRQEVLGPERAAYGQRILATLSQQLTRDFSPGYAVSALSRMITFADCFPDEPTVATLAQQLSWSHFVEILPLPDPLQRTFYAELCRTHRWSVRTLRDKIRGMLSERTALSKKPEILIQQELAILRDEDRMTPDLVFRNPYVLSALGLPDPCTERDLEAAILREMEAFLLELGDGFAFLARQKRMVIDGKDFKLDLLLYHRKLRRLVGIELKLGEFEPSYKGQMELYLPKFRPN